VRVAGSMQFNIKTAQVFIISNCSAVRKHPLELLACVLVFLVMLLKRLIFHLKHIIIRPLNLYMSA